MSVERDLMDDMEKHPEAWRLDGSCITGRGVSIYVGSFFACGYIGIPIKAWGVMDSIRLRRIVRRIQEEKIRQALAMVQREEVTNER